MVEVRLSYLVGLDLVKSFHIVSNDDAIMNGPFSNEDRANAVQWLRVDKNWINCLVPPGSS